MADVLHINTKDKTVKDRSFTQAEINETEDIVSLRNKLKYEVDRQAEVERLKYITPGTGQAMSYTEKRDEAIRASKEHSPDAADYPTLSADLGITANTIKEIATVVLDTYSQWKVVNRIIERKRLLAKKAIDSSNTPHDVLRDLDWSLE